MFSLIELVVVLVIIGLIVGGITSGQNLIRSAQLQSVATDVKRYQSAMTAFQVRYFALPGDMSNATDFWSAAHTTAATCRITLSTGEETCNGDGDGQIEFISDPDSSYEETRAWQHLANGGFIEGNYNGVRGTDTSAPSIVADVTAPSSNLTGAIFTLFYLGAQASDDEFWSGDFGHVFAIGSNYNSSGLRPAAGALTPE